MLGELRQPLGQRNLPVGRRILVGLGLELSERHARRLGLRRQSPGVLDRTLNPLVSHEMPPSRKG